MKPIFTTSPASPRDRRFGRKALQADRLARALQSSKTSTPKRSWRLPVPKPKNLLIACAVLVFAGGASVIALQYFSSQAAVRQKAEDLQMQKIVKAKSLAADACRRKKAAEKIEQIGKVTYDELYDHGECDK
jgi:hypothetical protein